MVASCQLIILISHYLLYSIEYSRETGIENVVGLACFRRQPISQCFVLCFFKQRMWCLLEIVFSEYKFEESQEFGVQYIYYED